MRIKASNEIDKFINLPENFGKQYKISNVLTQKPVDIIMGEKIYANLCIVKTYKPNGIKINDSSELSKVCGKELLAE